MTNINLAALNHIGKEWHKNDMHRFYINLSDANEIYRNMEEAEHGQMPLNRYERQNGKVWIDITTGEIMAKDIQDAEETISCIRELISHLS